MAKFDTLQKKIEERAEARIEKEIDALKEAIDKVMSKSDQRFKDALFYRISARMQILSGPSKDEVFETNLTNLFRKGPVRQSIIADLLPSYLDDETRDFVNKVNSIGKES